MLAPATAPAKAADDGSDYLTYTVRPGDTIYGVAQRLYSGPRFQDSGLSCALS